MIIKDIIMNLKTKFLIGILVIVIVLIGGWWIWNSVTVEKESQELILSVECYIKTRLF